LILAPQPAERETMKFGLRNFILLAFMLTASGLSVALRPTHKLAEQRPPLQLEVLAPKAFGDWREEPQTYSQVVDPQVQEFVKTIYQQTLSRTYVNSKGQRIMLSLAYVENQSTSFGVHLPEVCYPSQGFQVSERATAEIKIAGTSMPVERLVATMGGRVEPITYWVTVGDQVVAGSTQRKLAQMRFALHGDIPDGMLVRLSSIDNDRSAAYQAQARFADDFEAALPKDLHALLFGQINKP
jgi:EpsI family protein